MAIGEEHIHQLLRSLTDPNVAKIVIYGIGGVGKTWIAKRASERATESGLFDALIWVPLSNTCSIRKAQEKILERLPIPVTEFPLSGGEKKNGEKIEKFLHESKVLLVLDDAWFTEENAWQQLGLPPPRSDYRATVTARTRTLSYRQVGNPNSLTASKVIITTRTRRTEQVMLPDVVMIPDSLSRRESWDLLSKRCGNAECISSQLGEMVIGKCHGMPLSIILAAGAIKDVGGVENLPEIVSSALGAEFTTSDTTYRYAKLGCAMLPDQLVKDCLLFCTLFPADAGIHVSELIQCWILEGLVVEGGGELCESAYEKGRAVLKVLLDHYVLYKEDDDHVRMHGVVREVAFDIGRGRGFFGRFGSELGATPELGLAPWQGNKRVSLIGTMMKTLPDGPHCMMLSTLILKENRFLKVIPKAFFLHMPALRILDLSFTRIKKLPSSISNLSELRLLLLKGCQYLREAKHMSLLKNLEVLDVSGTTALQWISFDSFEHMSKLRVLNLSATPIRSLPPLSGLHELRHLILSRCRLLKSEFHLDMLTKLEVLDLSDVTVRQFPRGLSKLAGLKHLNFGPRIRDFRPATWESVRQQPVGLNVRDSVENASTIYIAVDSASFFQYLDKDSPLWGNCFQKFHFCICPLEEESMDDDVRFQSKQFVFRDTYFKTRHFAHSMYQGRYLEIHSIDSYPVGIEGVLNNAELISLNRITHMRRLSDLGLESMRAMRECWIERCDQVESIFSGVELNLIDEMGSLENLWVSNLENLSFLCEGMDRVSSFSCLRHLHIECCPSLTTLFASPVHLRNLETLEIKFCDRLESVLEESVSGGDALPRLHTLRLWELPELSSICGGVLPALKKLKVKECPKLQRIPIGVSDMSPLVMIRGEKLWWNNLMWDDKRIMSHFLFRRWGRF